MPQVSAVLAVAILVAQATSAMAAVDRYRITPAEHAACDGDAVALCSETYPDEDKLMACMKINHANLSAVCAKAFDAGLARRHMRL